MFFVFVRILFSGALCHLFPGRCDGYTVASFCIGIVQMQGFREVQCSSAHIGHLGLVADKIDSLGLTALIDERIPVSEAHGARVSHGERAAAMIFNGLGFIDSRLYLFTDFLEDKPLGCVPKVSTTVKYLPLSRLPKTS